MKEISVLYVPLEVGAKYGGTNLAPELFKQLKLEKIMSTAGLNVTNSHDIECIPRAELTPTPKDRPYVSEITRVANELAQLTENAVNSSKTVITIGGDHSLNLGVISGISHAKDGDIGLIYIDAHGDVNTPESSTSHNVHGMHLAALMGIGSDDMINTYSQGAKLRPENLLHIAGKDMDDFEVELMKKENISNYSMDDIQLKGMTPLLSMIDDLIDRVGSVWVSFDLDSIDMQYAPGVGIQNKGGLTYREAIAICRYIASKTDIAGLDLVECNPPKDVDNKTVQLGIDIILSLLGKNSQQYSDYMSEF